MAFPCVFSGASNLNHRGQPFVVFLRVKARLSLWEGLLDDRLSELSIGLMRKRRWTFLLRRGGSNCHPSYPTVCIPPPPPDLDCGDISFTNFRVVGSDPHGFDGDNDGVG
jgi:hypothetical protein